MTIQGAIAELQNLLNANDVPLYYKGGIQKVIETISMELAEQNARLGALERKINLHEKAMAKAMTDHKGEPQTEDFQDWKDRMWSEAVIEPQFDKDINVRSKDKPKICDTCRYYNSYIPCGSTPSACKKADKFAEEFVDGLKKLKPKDEPQTEVKIEPSWVGEAYGHFKDEQSGKE